VTMRPLPKRITKKMRRRMSEEEHEGQPGSPPLGWVELLGEDARQLLLGQQQQHCVDATVPSEPETYTISRVENGWVVIASAPMLLGQLAPRWVFTDPADLLEWLEGELRGDD